MSATRVSSGHEKLDFVNRCGATRCGVIGNGHNDAMALRAAALGVVVLASGAARRVGLREAMKPAATAHRG